MPGKTRITAYPTRRAIWAMALGLPISLLLALLVPAAWAVGAGWLAVVSGLCGLDWILSVRPASMRASVDAPPAIDVGGDAQARIKWSGAPTPQGLELSLSGTAQILIQVSEETGVFILTARRRGTAQILRLWQRWTGPLGLIWSQRVDRIDRDIAVVVDTARLTDDALKLFDRHAPLGQTLQRLRGEGTEFDALSEFVQGMDPRTIDWKHSARHGELLAREYDTEKNNQIVLAFDSGYLMSAESEDKNGLVLTKLDRALSSALLLAFLSLRLGDRTGLFAFDAKPYLFVPPVNGSNAFGQLKRESAKIDYSPAETNFTLGLTTLSQRLRRRSMIIIFSDFIDTIQSQLMLETVARLLKRHAVVFVTFENEALRALTDQTPDTVEAMAEAILSDRLQTERDLVLAKLERMGVSVINTRPDHLNAALINKYVELKNAHVL